MTVHAHHHLRTVCECGAVLVQCRCAAPKTDRVSTLALCGDCQAAGKTPAAFRPPADR